MYNSISFYSSISLIFVDTSSQQIKFTWVHRVMTWKVTKSMHMCTTCDFLISSPCLKRVRDTLTTRWVHRHYIISNMLLLENMLFQEIFIPTTRKMIRDSELEESFKSQSFKRKVLYEAKKLKFPVYRPARVQTKKGRYFQDWNNFIDLYSHKIKLKIYSWLINTNPSSHA